ncbi:cupredoxin domain-containing protein [Neobacillus niacini]|uniref:cupredoxin domain-containing protein n=1 Tax=Neobacillus niacini TaxID=86668 RepID=UPI000B15F592|nr:cupredoxin domain-containing protein [Neobacillus niacini]
MIGYDTYVLATLFFVIIASMVLTMYYRKRLTNMAGMVIAMVVGMNVGLTAGVFLGLLFQGNLFYSTIISILVGVIAGSACGFVLGILATLEGLMAGLMGGMMGAMLGEMITQNQAVTLVNVFLTLSVSSMLLFQILPNGQDSKSTKKWILKPIMTFIVFAGYLLLGVQLDKQFVFSKSTPPDNSHQNHEGQSIESLKELSITVHPSQYSYDPGEIIVKKDKPTSIILKNHDSIDHDIEIKEIPFVKKDDGEGHQHGHTETEADFHLHAPAKKQTKVTFTPLREGTYSFYCTIPGHKENGMTGILIVQ